MQADRKICFFTRQR
ncbi:UNVERIFIED_CONTAM: hypothetical protein GTU68_052407 [Idotea baltica]|nr:hypothetical protein [Idotea baltica]